MVKDHAALRQRFAHALLSPLTVVVGSAEMLLLEAGDWPDSRKELLKLIVQQGRQLQETLTAIIESADVDENTIRTSWTDTKSPPTDPIL